MGHLDLLFEGQARLHDMVHEATSMNLTRDGEVRKEAVAAALENIGKMV